MISLAIKGLFYFVFFYKSFNGEIIIISRGVQTKSFVKINKINIEMWSFDYIKMIKIRL